MDKIEEKAMATELKFRSHRADITEQTDCFDLRLHLKPII
jgi:hypothetical protein